MSTAYFTYGRFQPPHKGHAKILNALKEQANRDGVDHYVFCSHSYNDTNPILPEQKINFMQRLFPDNNIVEADIHVINPYHAMRVLDENYDHVKFFVGGDRVEQYQSMHEYMDHPTKGYTFETFEIVNAGDRVDESDDIAMMSGTRARVLASEGKYEEFASMIPTKDTSLVEELYFAIRKNINENVLYRNLISLYG